MIKAFTSSAGYDGKRIEAELLIVVLEKPLCMSTYKFWCTFFQIFFVNVEVKGKQNTDPMA